MGNRVGCHLSIHFFTVIQRRYPIPAELSISRDKTCGNDHYSLFHRFDQHGWAEAVPLTSSKNTTDTETISPCTINAMLIDGTLSTEIRE